MIDPIPYGYCQCGCGQKTSIARCNLSREKVKKGEPFRFVIGHNTRRADPWSVDDQGLLYCNRCKTKKRVCEFGRDKDTPIGYARKCRECNRNYQANRRKQRPEHCAKQHRAAVLKMYGCDLYTYQTLLEKQDHKCAICRQPETNVRKGKTQSLSIDHDHDSKKIRGLLCANCNVAIGMLRDDITILESAIDYLKSYTSSV
jgi:hypothetical protein